MGYSVQSRERLFYGVCIWVRIALAIGVGFAAHAYPTVTASIVLALALIAVAVNVRALTRDGPVWWSRPSHATLAGAIAIGAVLVLLKLIPPATLGLFVGLDVLFGIMYSLLVNPFATKS